jgi:hypothetical protein
VAALADAQHGTVAYAQLIALGLSASAIARAVSDGLLAALYRGVFAFGHVQLTRQGRWMAAVLAAGADAALSHTDGLVARGIVRSSAARIHVTVPRLTGGAHRRSGLVLHRCRLDPEDRDVVDGIPTTTVARALLDYAETTLRAPRRLERAIDEADKQGCSTSTPPLTSSSAPAAAAAPSRCAARWRSTSPSPGGRTPGWNGGRSGSCATPACRCRRSTSTSTATRPTCAGPRRG